MTNKQELKKDILAYMRESEKSAFEVDDISRGLQMTSADDFKAVVKAVADLEREGEILLNKKGRFTVKHAEGYIEGVFSSSARGFGFVRVEDMEDDIFIPPNKTGHALNRDRVLVSIEKQAEPWNDKGPEGSVREILERGTTSVIGLFTAYNDEQVEDTNYYGYVEPQDKKMEDMRVFIQAQGIRPVNDTIVQVEITSYPTNEKPKAMLGLVTMEIGHKNDPGVEIMAVVHKHGIPTEFSPETLEELEEIPDHVTEEEMEGRLDLRDLPTITIDGADAKDLDDAITMERLDNGLYRLGVHIADVAHYVREGTALDEDAFERGTSSYLTDRVIPMLPPQLSNGICSINPNVLRLALSSIMDINEKGDVVNYTIGPSMIISDSRMTYTDVNKILDGDKELRTQYSDYVTMLEDLRDLHNILESKRRRRGAINFDTPEAEVIVDEDGKPTDIVLRERGVGERMIESFMLAANETVAQHYNQRELPILYRVHERPDEAKMQHFIEFVSQLGISVKGTKDTVRPKQLQSILEKIDGRDEEAVVSMTLLRSMQQARYDTESLGHFGLASNYYSHFTAPIRRYPDLALHRLIHYYAEEGTSQSDRSRWQKVLPDIAEHSSTTERRAVDAEREVDAMKKVQFMADKVGQKFEAIIVSVLGFGMFVQLENTVEGLIHISSMDQDYFEYNEQGLMLIGQHTGVTYRVGQKIEVELKDVNLEQYELDFHLVIPEDAPKYERKKRSGGRGKGKPQDNRQKKDKKPQGNKNEKPQGNKPKKQQSSKNKKGTKKPFKIRKKS